MTSDDPNIFDIPETFPPSARAKPPPSKKTSDLEECFINSLLLINRLMHSPWCLSIDELPGKERT